MSLSALRMADTRDIERAEWLKLRRRGIGGSDAAAIAGLNPWRSPVQVYMEKVGAIPNDDEPSEAAYWGTVLEDVVAQEFTRRTQLKTQRINAILQHPEHPFMLANVDRRIVATDEGPGILECKTGSAFAREDWEDGKVPAHYMIQVQHYLAVTGYQYGYIAVLLGGRDFRYARIERDEELISYLINIEQEFWGRVERRDPPKFDGSDASSELLTQMYPEAQPNKAIDLPSEADLLIAEYELAKAEETAATERKEAAANRLKAMIGEAELGYCRERIVSWKQITSNRLDAKALKADHPNLHDQYLKQSSYRRFTITSVKE